MAPSSMGAYREEKRSLSTQCVGCSVVDRVGQVACGCCRRRLS